MHKIDFFFEQKNNNMSDLVGVWILESSENINEYLKQLGMSLAKRKTNTTAQPKLIISKPDESLWSIEIDMKYIGIKLFLFASYNIFM